MVTRGSQYFCEECISLSAIYDLEILGQLYEVVIIDTFLEH